MAETTTTTTAAAALVATLERHGVERAYCVPGESYLPVLDVLHDRPGIRLVTCRHEAGAGFAAVAEAKVTGRPGTLFVSRGPGFANAAVALHTARQDAVPLVVFVGQVERPNLGRGAFQEMDYRRAVPDLLKHAEEVWDAARLPEAAARAYAVAARGTPGPVAVALPEDMLEDACTAAPAGPRPVPRAAPDAGSLRRVAHALAGAARPVLIAGGLVRDRDALHRAAERWGLPVAATFKHQDLFDNPHPHFAGHLGYAIPPALLGNLLRADLLLAVGTRLGDVASQGYRLPGPGQRLIQVHPDPQALSVTAEEAEGLAADPDLFLAGLAALDPATLDPATLDPAVAAGRGDWIAGLHAAHADLAAWRPRTAPDGVDFGHVVRAFAAHAAHDAIYVTDAGNFSSWLHRHHPFTRRNLMIGAVGGAMGIGVPAGIGAALAAPGRQVIVLVGDGGFLMTGMELATAMREGLPIKIFISDNGSYGTIRLHQERRYPGRPVATGLTNPDFAALARAFGATAFTIRREDEADATVAAALAADGPVVVEVRSSLRHLSAYATIEE